mmetsp:Transcript_5073/g.15637  ORF Transcript_5073/g.15637 Transcript_5073/m.15637 type:complete len:211 (+) Transcript_5073:595-1227(+)
MGLPLTVMVAPSAFSIARCSSGFAAAASPFSARLSSHFAGFMPTGPMSRSTSSVSGSSAANKSSSTLPSISSARRSASAIAASACARICASSSSLIAAPPPLSPPRPPPARSPPKPLPLGCFRPLRISYASDTRRKASGDPPLSGCVAMARARYARLRSPPSYPARRSSSFSACCRDMAAAACTRTQSRPAWRWSDFMRRRCAKPEGTSG